LNYSIIFIELCNLLSPEIIENVSKNILYAELNILHHRYRKDDVTPCDTAAVSQNVTISRSYCNHLRK